MYGFRSKLACLSKPVSDLQWWKALASSLSLSIFRKLQIRNVLCCSPRTQTQHLRHFLGYNPTGFDSKDLDIRSVLSEWLESKYSDILRHNF